MAPTHQQSDALDRQIAVMRKLLMSLNAEYDALIKRDASALDSAIAVKNELIRESTSLLATTQTALADDNADRRSVLADTTLACRAQNTRNGALMRAQRRLIENALSWLRGGPPDGPIYGPDGDEFAARGPRQDLASA